MRVLTIIHQDDAGPGVFAEVAGVDLVPWRVDRDAVPALADIDACVVLGAAANVHEREAYPWIDGDVQVVADLIGRGVPTLGVCLGAQIIAAATGGSVRRVERPEIGWYEVALTDAAAGDPVFGALPGRFDSFQWHSFEAVPPEGATVLARSRDAMQGFRLPDLPVWAIQFHAEVSSADAAQWTTDYGNDPDAMGLDPVALQAENDRRMPAWHERGRALFARFVDAARAQSRT